MVAIPCARITRNDIALLSIPNTLMNLIRFARSPASVGHEAPVRLQIDTPIMAVAIVNNIATIVTTYKATLRCIEQACRTRMKLACCSAATMAGPAMSSSHNPLGVVACSSYAIVVLNQVVV